MIMSHCRGMLSSRVAGTLSRPALAPIASRHTSSASFSRRSSNMTLGLFASSGQGNKHREEPSNKYREQHRRGRNDSHTLKSKHAVGVLALAGVGATTASDCESRDSCCGTPSVGQALLVAGGLALAWLAHGVYQALEEFDSTMESLSLRVPLSDAQLASLQRTMVRSMNIPDGEDADAVGTSVVQAYRLIFSQLMDPQTDAEGMISYEGLRSRVAEHPEWVEERAVFLVADAMSIHTHEAALAAHSNTAGSVAPPRRFVSFWDYCRAAAVVSCVVTRTAEDLQALFYELGRSTSTGGNHVDGPSLTLLVRLAGFLSIVELSTKETLFTRIEEQHDPDHDIHDQEGNVVDNPQFHRAVQVASVRECALRAHDILKKYDKDGDGALNEVEFDNFWRYEFAAVATKVISDNTDES